MSGTVKSIVIKSLSYVVIVGGLTLALAQGARWLVSADPGAPPAVHRPPIPPRIADSIERRREPPPPPPPAVVAKPVVAQPVMQQAPVSLHPPPVQLRDSRRTKAGRRHPPQPAQALDTQAPAAQPAQPVVTTARSDAPY